MSDLVSVCGPVERVEGGLVLRVPLSVGGEHLAPLARGIGRIEGDFLVVEIPEWLADKLGIGEGSIVDLDNADGKFNIRPQLQN
jgi:hypothetical protein